MHLFFFTLANLKRMDILSNIREIRKEKGISHEAMAVNLGISQAAYTKLENKETKLTVNRLYKIAEILDTKIEKLLDLNTNKIYQQEFKDQSTNYQEIQNLYQENKDVYERLIESKDEQIVFMKSLLEK